MKLVKIECRYKPQGCTQIVSLYKKKSHEEKCTFNIVLPCPFMYLREEEEILESCSDEVTTKTILSHLTKTHHVSVLHSSHSKKSIIINLPEAYTGFPPSKLDRIITGPEGPYLVTISFLGGCELAIALLDNKKTQRLVTIELTKAKDRMTMSRPTYGLQADYLSVAYFQLTFEDLCDFADADKLHISISVTTSRN